MRGKRDGGGASNPTLSMLEVWWPGPRGEDVLRAKFRSLEDATRYVWRHDRVLEASVRFPSGEVRWARELDAPPLPPRVFRERPVDGAKLTREVCDRLPHLHEDDVAVADIVAVLTDNAGRGRALVSALAAHLKDRSAPCPEGCDRVLDTALITPPEARDPELLARLDAVAGRVLRD